MADSKSRTVTCVMCGKNMDPVGIDAALFRCLDPECVVDTMTIGGGDDFDDDADFADEDYADE